MQDTRGVVRIALFVALLAGVAFLAWAYFAPSKAYSRLSVSGHVSPSQVEPGGLVTAYIDSVSVTPTAHGTTPPGYVQSGACGSDSGYCPTSSFGYSNDLADNMYFASGPYYINSYAKPYGFAYQGVRFDQGTLRWAFDDWDTSIYYTGYVVVGATTSTGAVGQSDVRPIDMTKIRRAEFGFETYRYNPGNTTPAYPVVGVCTDSSDAYVASYTGLSDVSSGHSLSIWDPTANPAGYRTFTCFVGRARGSYNTEEHPTMTLSSYGSNGLGHVFVILTNTCYTKHKWGLWSDYCNDDGQTAYLEEAILTHIKPLEFYAKVAVVGDWSNSIICDKSIDNFGSSSNPWGYANFCSIYTPTSISLGTHTVGLVVCPEGEFAPVGGACDSDWYTYRTSNLYGTLGSFTVVDLADTVSLGNVVVSTTDDEYTLKSVTVSGGDAFDYVRVQDSCSGQYHDLQKSDFSCSGSTCTWSGNISFDTSVSGLVNQQSQSCTLTATLYVNGNPVANDSKSVTVYYPYVQSFTAGDVTQPQIDYTATICGAFDHYEIYLDNSSSAVDSGDVSPGSPGGCQTVQNTLNVSDVTPGTHTLSIKVFTSDGDEYTTSLDSFYANYTYTYRIDDFSVANSVYNTTSSSASVGGSITYYTDDPNGAILRVREGGQDIWTRNVSQTSSPRSVTWSANLGCGTHSVYAAIFDRSNVQHGQTSPQVVTVRCWNLSVGPSGTVQVPSDGTNVLPSAKVYVYYDVTVTPFAEYTATVTWNGTDISSKFQSGGGHTASAEITPADVPMSCGDNVTLTVKIVSNSTQVAQQSSNFTLQCVEQYVIFVLPRPGARYDTFGSASPSPDFQLPVAVNYAGGDTVKLYRVENNVPVEIVPTPADCNDLNVTADACYTISGTQLHAGDNILLAELYSGSTKIADSTVTFTVYAWSFDFRSAYSGDVGVLSVKEYGSHADHCDINFPDNNVVATMLYSEVDRQWDYSMDKATYDGKPFTITCYSPTGAVAYTYSGTVDFSSNGGGGGGGGGGSTTEPVAPPEAPEVIPFWPDSAAAGTFRWTVLDKDIFQDTMSSAAVSTSLVCVKPKDKTPVSAMYCPASLGSIPTTQDGLAAAISSAESAGCSAVQVRYVGELQCVPNNGAGLYKFHTSKGDVRILVAGSKMDVTTYVIAFAVLALAGLLIYAYYQGWFG